MQSFFPFDSFTQIILKNPKINLFWGDVGIGKTTIALQLSRTILKQQQKVFFLSTKQSPNKLLFSRLFKDLPEDLSANFLHWSVNTFNQQFNMVLQWPLQIQQLNKAFEKQKVGLIVIDEIATLYLLEMGTETKNAKLNEDFTLLLATLAQITQKYAIPIVLLNGFSLKQEGKEENEKDNSDSFNAIPYGGKILSYWTASNDTTAGLEIQISRTSQVSRMQFIESPSNQKSDLFSIPKKWTWLLGSMGFQ
ncbi:MAG: AAA family ATPase [Promethearchaeota archaeon]